MNSPPPWQINHLLDNFHSNFENLFSHCVFPPHTKQLFFSCCVKSEIFEMNDSFVLPLFSLYSAQATKIHTSDNSLDHPLIFELQNKQFGKWLVQLDLFMFESSCLM